MNKSYKNNSKDTSINYLFFKSHFSITATLKSDETEMCDLGS